MKRILCLAGFLLFLIPSAYAMEVTVTPEFWAPDLDASARIESNNVGDEVDFVSDLGMDDEDVLGATVDLKLGRSNHFLFSYWSVGFEGNKSLTRGFNFNGEAYNIGDRVDSSFDLDSFEFGYAFDLINFETFRAGFLLNVIYYALDMELRVPSNPAILDNREKIDLVFPAAGITLGMGFFQNKIFLSGQFAGLWWQGSGWWDTSAELSFHPVENAAIAVGYRAIHLDVSDDDDSANAKLDGLTVSASYRF